MFMDAIKQEERSALGDIFDRTIRSLEGRPDTIAVKATTVRAFSKVLERSQTFIIQTYREKDAGDTVFVEYIGVEGSVRIVLPTVVADVIARQRDALTDKSRSKSAKAAMATRVAQGFVPNFKKKK
jgi:hypothetical protein